MKNAPILAIGGVDTEENEHCEVCPLSVYSSSARCPWVKDMNLQTGDSVAFNLADEPRDEPQITRIVKLAA